MIENCLNEVISVAEAEKLWRLKPGTVRKACREKRIQARLSEGTWLTTKTATARYYGKAPL